MKGSEKHLRKSEKEIRRLLHLQQKQQVPVITFCKVHKINKATFYHWRNRFGLKLQEEQNFIPVRLSDQVVKPDLFAEIQLSSTVTVKLFQKVDASYFKELL